MERVECVTAHVRYSHSRGGGTKALSVLAPVFLEAYFEGRRTLMSVGIVFGEGDAMLGVRGAIGTSGEWN